MKKTALLDFALAGLSRLAVTAPTAQTRFANPRLAADPAPANNWQHRAGEVVARDAVKYYGHTAPSAPSAAPSAAHPRMRAPTAGTKP